MEKLTVTLEDRPVDIELAQYKRMFEAACSALAAIGDALGVDPEEGGAEPILDAIADLKASDSRPVKQEPVGKVMFVSNRKAPDVDWASGVEIKNGMGLFAAPVDAKAIRADEREKVMNEPLTKEMWERFQREVRAEALEEAAKWLAESGLIGSNDCAAAIRGLK